ncbi:hypothetical protein U14_04535 [Candidatus Moduliflexus flocculans]|uniref:HEPN domain-containing protein n=1 Tax=Candidatus Moduliflexus flocculans TaxID=1499966 RepID=A0A0S6W5J8_9BACT|nr:hypothetical protein U14_04535 [Candidatus Moduliflexus flocculans]
MNPISKDEYIHHRLNRAQETLAEAQMLFEGNHLGGAVNRIYYAVFYAVSALALAHDFTTSSHTQLRSYFNREFVKTGLVSIDMGKLYNLAYDKRTTSDYADFPTFEAENIAIMLKSAHQFIAKLRDMIFPEKSE